MGGNESLLNYLLEKNSCLERQSELFKEYVIKTKELFKLLQEEKERYKNVAYSLLESANELLEKASSLKENKKILVGVIESLEETRELDKEEILEYKKKVYDLEKEVSTLKQKIEGQ